jgi:hypothetical protein
MPRRGRCQAAAKRAIARLIEAIDERVLVRAGVAAERLGSFHHDLVGIGCKDRQRFCDELIERHRLRALCNQRLENQKINNITKFALAFRWLRLAHERHLARLLKHRGCART